MKDVGTIKYTLRQGLGYRYHAETKGGIKAAGEGRTAKEAVAVLIGLLRDRDYTGVLRRVPYKFVVPYVRKKERRRR